MCLKLPTRHKEIKDELVPIIAQILCFSHHKYSA